ncbi:MAG: hypothetical protein QMC80_08840 [Thermoplasmatales archaeon]|nr:hypothetical protein [Thermoplasmatales archaeon]
MWRSQVNNKTQYYFYDNLDRIYTFDSNGNPVARFVHNPVIIDEPISMQTSTGTYYHLFGGLGSVTGLTVGAMEKIFIEMFFSV